MALKRKLKRIVAMLTQMTRPSGTVAELQAGHAGPVDYEHRYAEHEREEEAEPGASLPRP